MLYSLLITAQQQVEPAQGSSAPIQPPYKLHFETKQVEQKPKKKSRNAAQAEGQEIITASTYKVPNMGPYPQDVPKKNAIRFTPIQGK